MSTDERDGQRGEEKAGMWVRMTGLGLFFMLLRASKRSPLCRATPVHHPAGQVAPITPQDRLGTRPSIAPRRTGRARSRHVRARVADEGVQQVVARRVHGIVHSDRVAAHGLAQVGHHHFEAVYPATPVRSQVPTKHAPWSVFFLYPARNNDCGDHHGRTACCSRRAACWTRTPAAARAAVAARACPPGGRPWRRGPA